MPLCILACALAHKACLEGHKALYQRLPRLLHDLEIAKGDGRYRTMLASLQRIDLLVLDDRYDTRSTLITSQLPISAWHDYLADPTLADAILDRFIHNAHHLDLKGDSTRKTKCRLTKGEPISEG